MRYKIIRIDSIAGIYSEKAKKSIGSFHYGIQVGDIVYDNLTTKGMKINDWLTDLGVGCFGIEWDYSKIIVNR